MTLVKRIILSITRRPIKSLLLLVLSFALGTFIGSSYLISRAVNGLETNIKHNLDTYVVISYKDIDEYKNLNNVEYKDNQNKFLEKYNEISMKEYADNSSLLQYTKYTSFSSWNSNISHPSISFFVDYLKYSVSIMGTDLLFFDFYGETIDIVEGRCINKEDIENQRYVTIIDKDYTYPDGSEIQIGDIVKVEYNKFDLETDGTVTQLNSLEYEFEVIGKYEMKDIGRNKFLDETYLMYPLFIPNNLFSQIKNEIETTNSNKNLNYENNTFIYLNALFKLDSVDSIEDFRNDYLRLFNDSDHYEAITTGDEYYYDIKGSLDNMSMISSVTMFIAGVTSIFIGTLTIYLYLKDRTKEIGILISMGEYKKKIIIQLVCEVAILGLIGLSLSLIASSILGNVIMDHGLNIPSAIIEDYSVNIDIIYIFCMYGIGAVVIIISSIIPVWHLLKSRPKDILL